jgi:hypothetical protein
MEEHEFSLPDDTECIARSEFLGIEPLKDQCRNLFQLLILAFGFQIELLIRLLAASKLDLPYNLLGGDFSFAQSFTFLCSVSVRTNKYRIMDSEQPTVRASCRRETAALM